MPKKYLKKTITASTDTIKNLSVLNPLTIRQKGTRAKAIFALAVVGHAAGIEAYIQPGGSIRDNDSIEYCKQNNLAMVITGMRHFKH